jgi:CxxC motif-containing protein (DUF1111 family)
MITSRTLIATFGAAAAALLAMAWLSLAHAGAEAVQAGQGGLDAAIGKALFEPCGWPHPTQLRRRDGLGHLFNARSCAACHEAGRSARISPDYSSAR